MKSAIRNSRSAIKAPRWVHYFSDPLPGGVDDPSALLGGKGAGLKEMSFAGLAVPAGFTITTECCAEYFEQGKRWPDGLEQEVRENLARLEEEAGRPYAQGIAPLLVSVRSGAAVSMPGMMDTILNCGLHAGLADAAGDTPEFWNLYLQFIRMFAKVVHGIDGSVFDHARFGHESEPTGRKLVERCLEIHTEQTGESFPTDPWNALVRCISAVFESWENDRAIAYRQRNDIRGLKGTAVNVQLMFPSEVSGIVFTRDPNDLKSDRMVIEASYGLGESVVSGDVTPDRFLVHRRDRSIESEIGHKHCMVSAFGQRRGLDPDAPSLSKAQLTELTDLSLKIEEHFGYPVDIEFGWVDGEFGLLQSRRIRGLEIAEDVEIGRQEEIFRLREITAGRRRCWVIHNLAETLRAPTPFTWDIVCNFMKGSGGFGRMYSDLGYQPSERVRRDGFLELICGRIYADPERLAELFWDAMPLTYDLDALAAGKRLLDRAPGKFDPERADGRFLARLPATLWRMGRIGKMMSAAGKNAKARFEQTVLPAYLSYIDEKRRQDLSNLPDEHVVAELHERRRKVLDGFGAESLKPGFFGGLALDRLTGTLVQLMGEEHGSELASTLTRALDGDTTFEQDVMLRDVALGNAALGELVEKFGHRCVGEMELSVPRWREDHSYLEQIIRQMKTARGRDPREIHHENQAKRHEAEKELPDLLKGFGGSTFEAAVLDDLAIAQELLPYRESGKHYLMMGYELIRVAAQELAERWDLGGRFYSLNLDELDGYRERQEAIRAELQTRRIRHQAFLRLDVSDVIDSRDLESLGLAEELEDATELAGVAMASGVATGPAQIVFDPQAAGDIGEGYILVCASTDPGWTPLFMQARGLVVERGGVLSHGAIVARDFGIPAVACSNATRLIRTGDTVRVDGNAGRVAIVERNRE